MTPDRDAWGFGSVPPSPTPASTASLTAAKAPIVSTKRGLGRPLKLGGAIEKSAAPANGVHVEEEPAAAWAAWEQDDEDEADATVDALEPDRPVETPLERLTISAQSKGVVELAEALLEDARRAGQSECVSPAVPV